MDNSTQAQILHEPVMAEEMLEALSPKKGEVYIDATFGAGGYSKKILESGDCRVIAIDRDPQAETEAKKLRSIYGERLSFIRENFAILDKITSDMQIEGVDGIIMDLGVSSVQLDSGERGFSFNKEAELDMRMSCTGRTAKDVVNKTSKKKLASIIYDYGEERKAKPIAAAIEAERKKGEITTTTQLAEIVRTVVGKKHSSRIDPATKTFQALRIYVNDELIALEQALDKSKKILNHGGRLVTVAFHGLEDKIIKNFMRDATGNQPGYSRYYLELPKSEAEFEYVNKKVIKPGASEVQKNIRARSAKLRAIRKKVG